MNKLRTRVLTQAREALLVARARCLAPGYYPDTMAARVEESTDLLPVAMAAARMAASVLAREREHAGLAAMLRKASTRGSFIFELDPAELIDAFALALPTEPVEEQAPVEECPPEAAILDE